jgi:hypothetical protein
MNWILRNHRNEWYFPIRELSFFVTTLIALIALLDSAERPDQAVLVDQRMNLFTCEYMIKYRLAGVRELGRAAGIEFLGQSEFDTRITLEELQRGAIVALDK